MFGFRKGLGTSDALIQLLDAIKEHRAAGDFVAILTCDASAAFDLLHHDLVISMLKRLGSGPKVTKFVESFLSGTEQFVTVNDCESDTWSLDVGSGQGHVLSPPLFNIGTLSQYFWSAYSILFGYADDGTDLVYGQTIDECNEKIRKVMAARQQWYKLAGMSLNVEKTKIMGFGFSPNPLMLGNIEIEPSSSMKFLGFTIQSNLGQDIHVNSVASKIRLAAAQIRADAKNFLTSDRRRLYMGWVQGALCSNGSVYLPLLTQTETDTLQTACNAAIRSIVKLPRKSWDVSISLIRKKK